MDWSGVGGCKVDVLVRICGVIGIHTIMDMDPHHIKVVWHDETIGQIQTTYPHQSLLD